MTLRQCTRSLRALAILLLCAVGAVVAQAQTPQAPSFLADKYEVSAYIDTVAQGINAVAKVQFRAQEVSQLVRVELHENLEVREVKGPDGKPLPFQREPQNPMYLVVTLPTPVGPGQATTLTFSYGGLLANEENSPVPNLRVASINKDWSYLLLPSRWFPLTNYPANRYTATFKLNVPENVVAVGTGKADSPQPMPERSAAEGKRLMYIFHCDERPEPYGSFVMGPLQLNPKQAEGINIAVYAPPEQSAKAQEFANDVAHQEIIFSDMFGELPEPDLTVVQLPDGTVRDFAGPGVIMLSHRIWDPKSSDRRMSQLVASQWWGIQILPASTADVWITDGLSRYSEELYAEQAIGKEAGLRAIDEFAVGALMYDDTAPVAQSARLIPYSPEYRSVVMNKGAMLFHMIRAEMGDVPFKSLLHQFYAKYKGKTATIADFENLAVAQATASAKGGEPPNLQGFFAQWLNSTGIPEFTLEYVVYRTRKGFRILGKVKQPIDTFSMPVQMRIDTEGNPETKTVDVVGTDSPFMVETFGRPKPGGIHIDPGNTVLKSTPGLRARAAIARGEELAEVGKYYDAVQQYQRALSIQPNRTLANFRMGEAFFYQKNYQAAANAFREALATVPEPSEKWTEVWSHIYLGKVFDLLGQRERALHEYDKARQTNDNTGGAQQYVEALIKKPYTEGATVAVSSPASGSTPDNSKGNPADVQPPSSGDKPVLKRPSP